MGQKLDLDGGGWRMPTMDELQSLYRPRSTYYNRTPLLKCTGFRVWSGEAKDSSEAWYMEFQYSSGQFKGWTIKTRRSISFNYSQIGDYQRTLCSCRVRGVRS